MNTHEYGCDSRTAAMDDFLSQPDGDHVCFFSKLQERFSFDGIKALLWYMLMHHRFSNDKGYAS